MSTVEDTIAAIATPAGDGGVAIVRASGPDAIALADKLFRCPDPPPSRRRPSSFVYGHVVDGAHLIDEALLLIMRAPHSYTTEDMIEIQGHGSTIVARRILRAMLTAGARSAEPGEFTQRAFLNGRIDLLQAEAVLDIVHAHSERAADAALLQLAGNLSNELNTLYDGLLPSAADLEASLDFPDDEMPTVALHELPARLAPILDHIDRLLATWDEGRLLRNGALVVISGAPNVGKSTLLNALLDTHRAIVSHMPGTTRDTIEEGLVLDGIPIRLVDTAGLRSADCDIEREGIERTRQQMQRADLHLVVCDASTPLPDDIREGLASLPKSRTIIVLNKIDLGEQLTPPDFQEHTCIPTCLLDLTGLDAVRQAMRSTLEAGLDLAAPPHVAISERHRFLLIDAKAKIAEASEMISRDEEDLLVLAASSLRDALLSIGYVTGRTYEDELLQVVFSRFCVGK